MKIYPEIANKRIFTVRMILLLVTGIIWLYAFYALFFMPSRDELHPFSFDKLSSGKWAQLSPFESFISGPVSSTTNIVEDSTKQKYLHFNTDNANGTYAGLIFHVNQPVPRNSEVVIEWRSSAYKSGVLSGILLDVMDGSLNKNRDLGENFYAELSPPESSWQLSRVMLDSLILNDYQINGTLIDGHFDYNNIRRVSLTFYPNTKLSLDIKDVYLCWSTNKWTVSFSFIILGLVGIFLFYRTSSGTVLFNSGRAFSTNALISRIIFMLVSISAILASIIQGPDVLNSSTIMTYIIMLVLILLDEFSDLFEQDNYLWSLRYLAVFYLGYFLNFAGGVISIAVLFLASFIPLIVKKSRAMFIILTLVAVGGYFLKPPMDSHFSFIAGLVMLIGASVAAIIVWEILQQQHAEFLTDQAIKQYEALFKKTSDAIYILDNTGLIETVNQGFEQLVGLNKSELVGRNIAEFVHTDSIALLPVIAKSVEADDSRQFDLHIMRRDGEVRTVLVRASAIYSKKQLAGYQALATDITERKIAEEKLKESSRKLEELNSNKDKLFSIISHDLKSPFNSLLGFSDLLLKEYDDLSDEERKLFATNIYHSIQNLYKLLDNLLQWAMVQSGKMDYFPQNIDLKELVENCLGILRGNAVRKQICVTNAVEKGVFVYADQNSINSVIQNLIVNAIKFSNAEGKVEISARKLRGTVEVTVSDTGIGMTKEELEKLFRIDVHHTTKGTASESGTGLGLILCKEMIENNAGTIRVESQPGKGSKFIFTLPEYSPGC